MNDPLEVIWQKDGYSLFWGRFPEFCWSARRELHKTSVFLGWESVVSPQC